MYHLHKTVTGSIEIDMTFASPLSEGHTLVIMGMFDAVCHLDQHSKTVVRM